MASLRAVAYPRVQEARRWPPPSPRLVWPGRLSGVVTWDGTQPRCVGRLSLQRCHLPVPPSLHGVSWAQFPRFGGTMRHSDSSPPIPPRFVAFARRYHPSTCGSLRRTPGATSTASGLVSRCPRPGGLYDGDDEASRVPGKPTRTHATRSDPGEVAASTASETRRDDLPSNARRRPSHSMHFGAQSRGLRAPCERFAPGVTPGPRITRFRLAADLGRMGLDTHRVSNKVSKITSRHLVPLDRAFPAHALLHES